MGLSLDLASGVGSVRSEAARSIPHSLSLFSPFHIYPTGSSPHTEPHLGFSHRGAEGELQPHQAAELETSLLEMKPEGNQLMVCIPADCFLCVTSCHQQRAQGCCCLDPKPPHLHKPGWSTKSCFEAWKGKRFIKILWLLLCSYETVTTSQMPLSFTFLHRQ